IRSSASSAISSILMGCSLSRRRSPRIVPSVWSSTLVERPPGYFITTARDSDALRPNVIPFSAPGGWAKTGPTEPAPGYGPGLARTSPTAQPSTDRPLVFGQSWIDRRKAGRLAIGPGAGSGEPRPMTGHSKVDAAPVGLSGSFPNGGVASDQQAGVVAAEAE